MARYSTPIPALALGFMNDDHAEELQLLEAAALAAAATPPLDRAAVMARLGALAAHTQAHFEREEAVMREVGFPPYPVHKAEHDRVLAEFGGEVAAYEAGGDAARLLAYLDAVVSGWFPSHMASMDTITAQFAAMRGKR
ncbi:MAG: hemerythrin family protein [Anaeromyxobacteraceae bacterium]